MKKSVNLADKKAAYELLKQWHESDETTDDVEIRCTARASGATGIGGLVELPSRSEGIFSQNEQ